MTGQNDLHVMTLEDAVAYPVIYAPDHAFAWKGEFMRSVYRIMHDWSDDRPDRTVGSVLGWVDKHQLGLYLTDDEVTSLALISVRKPSTLVWVAGSDMLWSIAKYDTHIHIAQPEHDGADKADFTLGCPCDKCTEERRFERSVREIRDATKAANEYMRSRLDGRLSMPINRQILQSIGANMCLFGLVDEVIERRILFADDAHGLTDSMKIYLANENKVVDVRISSIL